MTGDEPRPIGSFQGIAAGESNGDWYEHLVAPRSVAIVGASADPAKGSLLRNMLRLGFSGDVVPVNPHGGTIEGLRVASTIAEVEGKSTWRSSLCRRHWCRGQCVSAHTPVSVWATS